MPQGKHDNLSNRLLDFSARIIKLMLKLEKTATGRVVGGQLIRSATSAGANYEEACGGESRADFIHKLQIVLKELKESVYWLKLMIKSSLITDAEAQAVLTEGEELARIIAKSVITAKNNKGAE